MTVGGNIAFGLEMLGWSKSEVTTAVDEMLELVKMQDLKNRRPAEISGGQQQRVAIARAIINRPALLLADEPTGALDSTTTAEVLDLFDDLHSQGITLVLVTHEDDVAERAREVARFQDGRVVELSCSGQDRSSVGGRS